MSDLVQQIEAHNVAAYCQAFPHMDWGDAVLFTQIPNRVVDRIQVCSEAVPPFLDRVIRYYRERLAPVQFQLTPITQPADLPAYLRRRGFVHTREDAVLVFMEDSGGIPDNRDLEVRPAGQADLPAYVHAFMLGFDMPDTLRRLWREIFQRWLGHPGVTLLLGRLNGTPVGTAQSVRIGDTVGIYSVSTRREFRRRGIATTLTRRLVHLAREQGARTIYLDTVRDGDPERLYNNIGFRTTYYRQRYRL